MFKEADSHKIEKKEYIGPLEQGVINAINSASNIENPDINNIVCELERLNELLVTGYEMREDGITDIKNGCFSPEAKKVLLEDLKSFIEQFRKIGRVGILKVYLGDGGSSRINLSAENGKIFVSIASESTSRARLRWDIANKTPIE